MARRKVGRVREKLSDLLALHGLIVAPEDLWIQEGAYRSHYWDLARWGSYRAAWRDGKDPDGKLWAGQANKIQLTSWDRMTDCVRYGVEISSYERGGGWNYVEVHRKEQT